MIHSYKIVSFYELPIGAEFYCNSCHPGKHKFVKLKDNLCAEADNQEDYTDVQDDDWKVLIEDNRGQTC